MIDLMLKNFFLLAIVLLLFNCSSEVNDSNLILSDNQIAWVIDGQNRFAKNIQSSWVNDGDNNKIYITGAIGNEGVLLQINTTKENLVGTFPFGNGVSMIYNEKRETGLAVFQSEACKTKKGNIIIEKVDKVNKTISGSFRADLCAKGKFILHGNTSIQEGKFKAVKYHESTK